jgi:hypothetical protein
MNGIVIVVEDVVAAYACVKLLLAMVVKQRYGGNVDAVDLYLDGVGIGII